MRDCQGAHGWDVQRPSSSNLGCDNSLMRPLAPAMLSAGIALMLAAAIGCTKIPPPTPLSQLNPQQLRGYDVFHQRCIQCHNDRINQPLNGPTLRSLFKKQYLNSGAPANDDRVMGVILYGYGIMPAMGRTMAPAERDDLLAYLHTL
jgi:mono/diheme cytochrome c family protein